MPAAIEVVVLVEVDGGPVLALTRVPCRGEAVNFYGRWHRVTGVGHFDLENCRPGEAVALIETQEIS